MIPCKLYFLESITELFFLTKLSHTHYYEITKNWYNAQSLPWFSKTH